MMEPEGFSWGFGGKKTQNKVFKVLWIKSLHVIFRVFPTGWILPPVAEDLLIPPSHQEKSPLQ